MASGDQDTIAKRLALSADSFDLAEPFERIREAIDEAPAGRAGGVWDSTGIRRRHPIVRDFDLALAAIPFATGWNGALPGA